MHKHSICTLGLALTLAIHPGLAQAASHCKGLEEVVCGSTAACKWAQAQESKKYFTKDGQPMTRKAHCRLDVAAAAKLAAEIARK